MDEPRAAADDAVGLDIGGSKTHGVLIRAGRVVAEARAGSANVQNVSAAEAAANLADVFGTLDAAGARRVVAGAGGVDTEEDAQALAGLIRTAAPQARIDVVHDTRLILAAGRAAEGIAVIAGTGSAAWGTTAAGRQGRSGGWGYLLGDEGSAYWIAREAVRHALHRHDLGRDPDALSQALLQECELTHPQQLISRFHTEGRRYWAARAGAVFAAAAAEDRVAQQIIDRAAADLARLARDVADRLELAGPVVVGGGLGMHQPLLQDRVREHMLGLGLTQVRFLDQDPARGVLFLLEQEQA